MLFVGVIGVACSPAAPAPSTQQQPAQQPPTQLPAQQPAAPAAPTQAPVAPPTQAAAAKPAAPATAKDSKPFVISQGVDVETLDPQFAESGALGNILTNMFDYLVTYDEKMNLVPAAAESWQLLPDKVTYQFKLRKGIKFWNGEPLDAKAVKFTIDRMLNQDLRKQGLNDPFPGRVGLDRAEIVDDYTVNLVVKKPTILFPVYLTFVTILAPDYYTKNTPQQTAIKPMGSGPYMFKEWIKDDHLTLEANPNYWQGAPPFSSIVFRPAPETSTRTAMLQRGEADLVIDLAPGDMTRVEGDAKLRVCKANTGRRVQISIPTEAPLFKDKRVRQAFNYAVDFDAINKSILQGLGLGRMTTPVNGEFWIDPSIKPYPYDPEKAKQLLKEANWDPNTQVIINTPAGRYLRDKELAQAVAGMLQKVGVKAEAQVLEWTVFSDKARKSQFDQPYLIGYGTRFFGPDDLSVTTEPGFQGFEWLDNTESGPEARKLTDELKSTFDEKKQQEIVYKVSRMFVDEAPWLFLWNQVSLFGTTDRVECGDSRVRLVSTSGWASSVQSRGSK